MNTTRVNNVPTVMSIYYVRKGIVFVVGFIRSGLDIWRNK